MLGAAVSMSVPFAPLVGRIIRGCGHATCGHLHDGECWKRWHSTDAHSVQAREAGRTKQKRKAAVLRDPESARKRPYVGREGGRFARKEDA